jgi:hypothetical protein
MALVIFWVALVEAIRLRRSFRLGIARVPSGGGRHAKFLV